MSRGERTTIKLVGVDIEARTSIDTSEVVDYLDGLADRMNDFEPVMQRFGAYIVDEHIPRQFRNKGTPKRWAALTPRYAEWKRRNYGNKPLLVLTGKMRGGFRYKTTRRTLKVVNKAPYWQYHQDGTEKMTARPMIQLNERDYKRLRQYAQAYILSASITSAGGGL